MIKPKDILDLSRTDPVIGSFVRMWMDGRMSWESCLMECVFTLHNINKKLEEGAIKEMQSAPPGLRVIINENHPDYEVLKARGLL